MPAPDHCSLPSRSIATRKRGLGTAQMAVLQAISDGRVTEMDMKYVLKPYAAGTAAIALLRGLRGAGLIGWHRRGDRYYLTGKGRDQLPAVQPAAVMRPYVPPQMPPRRPGAMVFAGLPSVAAGREIGGWRQPC